MKSFLQKINHGFLMLLLLLNRDDLRYTTGDYFRLGKSLKTVELVFDRAKE
jgi:hypothetical protein